MNFPTIPQNLTKSPLGIIGMFIVLVYSVAGGVFGLAAGTLHYSLQLILVLFMVGFPGLILFVFYKLITKHTNKAYGPGDFPDIESFFKNRGFVHDISLSMERTISDYGAVAEDMASNILASDDFAVDNPQIPTIQLPDIADGVDFSKASIAPSSKAEILGKEKIAIASIERIMRAAFKNGSTSPLPFDYTNLIVTTPDEDLYFLVKLVTQSSPLQSIVDEVIKGFDAGTSFLRLISGNKKVTRNAIFVIDESDEEKVTAVKDAIDKLFQGNRSGVVHASYSFETIATGVLK